MNTLKSLLTTLETITHHHDEVMTGAWIINEPNDDTGLLDLGANFHDLELDALRLAKWLVDHPEDDRRGAVDLAIIQNRLISLVAEYERCKLQEAALIDPDVLADWYDEGLIGEM